MSAEAWGDDVDINGCNPANGFASGICSATCAAATTLYNFNAGGVKYESYTTVAASDANCKAACLTACINYRRRELANMVCLAPPATPSQNQSAMLLES